MLQQIKPDWRGRCVVVAGSGPSLTFKVASACEGLPTIAVNDAYRIFPEADILYACDAMWWGQQNGAPGFYGKERWSSHGSDKSDDKRAAAQCYGLNLIRGQIGEGFSLNPGVIHYGDNSGFQAINLAVLKLGGGGRILLVGFDMRLVSGKRHFFGEHPAPLNRNSPYERWMRHFDRAAQMLPPGLEIINCTPDSALHSFPRMSLTDALPVAA